ncbi:MAG: peptidoglycan binding protein CsiV [Sedimenticola sp.]|nr:peptidoglycan binding protein CsiV [Sedimenticola sp.]
MMKSSQLLFTLLIFLISVPQVAKAANEATWYDIELILFKQGSSYTAKSEHWPADPGSPDWSDAVNLIPGVSGEQRPYALLPRSDWRLTAAFNALRKTRGELEPLFHQAWRQPVASSRSAKAIYLQSNPNISAGLFEGVIKISVNRYLHVDMDLLLKNVIGNNTASNNSSGSLSPTFGSVRVTGKRRMRSGETHYIDHPMMGALILISRIEEKTAAPEPATPVETETTAEPDTAPQADAKPAAAVTN